MKGSRLTMGPRPIRGEIIRTHVEDTMPTRVCSAPSHMAHRLRPRDPQVCVYIWNAFGCVLYVVSTLFADRSGDAGGQRMWADHLHAWRVCEARRDRRRERRRPANPDVVAQERAESSSNRGNNHELSVGSK